MWLLLSAALAYNDDGRAGFWERALRDRACAGLPCGFPGITLDECHERGCCWDPTVPSTQTWCHGTPKKCASRADCNDRGDCADGFCACDAGFEGFTCNATVMKKVHVIQSCHLDAGFTDTTAGVLNTYFTRHLPNAIATAAALRNDSSLPDGWRLKFMAQSFYVALYLHCPTYIEGLTCPTEAEKQALIAALKDGSVYYHAFPNNAELETMSPTMLREGLRATHALDAELGLPKTRSLSQRDVPGAPKGAIPILNASGVGLISVGVNTASMYPRVPRIFRWESGATSTIAM